MLTQITPAFKSKWIEYTTAHAKAWRAAHPEWKTKLGTIVKSITINSNQHKQLTSDVFDLWLAAKLRVAQLKPEIPYKMLWDPSSSLFDAHLAEAMTVKQFKWLNRHASFADYGNAANAAEPGEEAYDTHRKRRELRGLA